MRMSVRVMRSRDLASAEAARARWRLEPLERLGLGGRTSDAVGRGPDQLL